LRARNSFQDRAALFLATGAYVGNVPFAPGTFGSVIALPICYLIGRLSLAAALFIALLVVVTAVWAAQRAEKTLGRTDPGCIVIDEIAGMVITLVGIPFTLASVVLGVIMFRALDILKPFPIRQMERRIPGGFGVVMDDVVAGLMGNVLLRFILAVL
jgi:phosphatidylglycerophosphatase A